MSVQMAGWLEAMRVKSRKPVAAQFGLYQDKKLILCPHETQNLEAEALVGRLWQAVGAHIFRMSAQGHDAVFAAGEICGTEQLFSP